LTANFFVFGITRAGVERAIATGILENIPRNNKIEKKLFESMD